MSDSAAATSEAAPATERRLRRVKKPQGQHTRADVSTGPSLTNSERKCYAQSDIAPVEFRCGVPPYLRTALGNAPKLVLWWRKRDNSKAFSAASSPCSGLVLPMRAGLFIPLSHHPLPERVFSW